MCVTQGIGVIDILFIPKYKKCMAFNFTSVIEPLIELLSRKTTKKFLCVGS